MSDLTNLSSEPVINFLELSYKEVAFEHENLDHLTDGQIEIIKILSFVLVDKFQNLLFEKPERFEVFLRSVMNYGLQENLISNYDQFEMTYKSFDVVIYFGEVAIRIDFELKF